MDAEMNSILEGGSDFNKCKYKIKLSQVVGDVYIFDVYNSVQEYLGNVLFNVSSGRKMCTADITKDSELSILCRIREFVAFINDSKEGKK